MIQIIYSQPLINSNIRILGSVSAKVMSKHAFLELSLNSTSSDIYVCVCVAFTTHVDVADWFWFNRCIHLNWWLILGKLQILSSNVATSCTAHTISKRVGGMRRLSTSLFYTYRWVSSVFASQLVLLCECKFELTTVKFCYPHYQIRICIFWSYAWS